MDSKELRNLQEAYMEVVMGEGAVNGPYDRAQTNRGDFYGRAQKKNANKKPITKKKKPFYYDEQKNIYDTILSHLLDGGYAETPEAAEAIMVNMSEEWRDDIVEELTGERRKRAEDILSKYDRNDPRASALIKTIRDKEGSRIGTGKFPTKRGGYGKKGEMKAYSLGGGSDRGEGNKAARRAGKSVQDTRGDED
jgi:hypothetical protein